MEGVDADQDEGFDLGEHGGHVSGKAAGGRFGRKGCAN
jgi:hypothetical protein